MRKKIVLISNDKVGSTMAGPGIRYFELSNALSKYFKVTLLVPDECDKQTTNFSIKSFNSNKFSSSIVSILKNEEMVDYVISQNLRPPLLRYLKKNKIKYIADLYDPLTIEVLEYTKFDSKKTQINTLNFNCTSLSLQLNTAEHILCASDIQKDFYLGIMSCQRLINPITYEKDPTFENKISLAPFGIPDNNFKSDPNFDIQTKFPNINKNDTVIYWGGGIWDWFDPMSTVKAIELLSKKRNDIKLFFLGVKHPNPKIKEMATAQKVLDYCKEKDLLDKYVFFNFGWTPYEERINYLSRANIGISTHLENLETRFSFRTRILDYFWAELPIITTVGDSMSAVIEKNNLGISVQYQDVKGIANAIEEMIEKKDNNEFQKNIQVVKKRFLWSKIANDIYNIINSNRIEYSPLSFLKFNRLALSFYLSGFCKKFFK